MSSNRTALIEYWGLKCPQGGKVHICENSWTEFFGCCTSDPCGNGIGVCPSDHVRPMSFDRDKYSDFPVQDCLNSMGPDNWYTCAYTEPPFTGCCEFNACGSRCSSLVSSKLSEVENNRLEFLYPSGLNLTRAALEPISTLPPTPFATSLYNQDSSRRVVVQPGAMIGICVAVLVAAFLFLVLIATYYGGLPFESRKRHDKTSYSPIITEEALSSSERTNKAATQPSSNDENAWLTSKCKPRKLAQPEWIAFIGWLWNIVLTLIPLCFIALAIAVVDLDGQMKSSYGQNVLELTRLGPSLYPILFAAVAGRFYKNLARWSLEQPGGVRLAVLEQVLGSQSFATALERVFVVHTHVFLSVLILSTWALSPLGGQSSSRILSFGKETEVSNGTVNYLHPTYQVSSSMNQRSLVAASSNIEALYSSCLLATLKQKRSPRDTWELPKIPQWKSDMKIGETYLVDHEALENGTEYYASLIGIKLRGWGSSQGRAEYNFTVQTSYINLQCVLADDKALKPSGFLKDEVLKSPNYTLSSGSLAGIKTPLPWSEWKNLENPPPLQLLYLSRWQSRNRKGRLVTERSLINCTMQTIWIETELKCGPSPSATSCYAHQQRRVKGETSPNRLPRLMTKNYYALREAISVWPELSSDWRSDRPSATEYYILEESQPFGGEDLKTRTGLDPKSVPKQISRRLTTSFNTFWDATLNPFGHTNVTFSPLDGISTVFEDDINDEPFMNSTTASRTIEYEVYRASQLWVAILLTTTLFLQILAILGLVLEVLIVGPEILGYASSFTRDNPYVPLPTSGSGLGGPERARVLRDLRLQLADVRPDEDIGYLAVRAVPTETVDEAMEQCATEPTNADGVSKQVLLRRLDSKRLYR
ncbi:hypothetical protein FSST1_000274 [Fusarium sambucinum]